MIHEVGPKTACIGIRSVEYVGHLHEHTKGRALPEDSRLYGLCEARHPLKTFELRVWRIDQDGARLQRRGYSHQGAAIAGFCVGQIAST